MPSVTVPLWGLIVMGNGKETRCSYSGRISFPRSLFEIRDSGLDSGTLNSKRSETVQSRRQRGYADGCLGI